MTAPFPHAQNGSPALDPARLAAANINPKTGLASDYLNHPDGINLMWNTWLPLPGLLLSPLTLLFGPVLTFNVLVTLAYGLSAWSAYLAIHRYVPSHGAAACGGLVYGFSPAMVGHSHHPNPATTHHSSTRS